MFQLYILTDCSLSQVPGRQHDFKEVSLESRRENYQTESRKFEHSLAWRLVLFSLGIYARSSTYLFTQFHRSWQGGTLEIIGRELRVRNHISEKPKSPIIFIIYYKFQFLRVRHSLAERYRSVVVSIRFREKWAFFQSSGNIAFG